MLISNYNENRVIHLLLFNNYDPTIQLYKKNTTLVDTYATL